MSFTQKDKTTLLIIMVMGMITGFFVNPNFSFSSRIFWAFSYGAGGLFFSYTIGLIIHAILSAVGIESKRKKVERMEAEEGDLLELFPERRQEVRSRSIEMALYASMLVNLFLIYVQMS